MPLYTRNGSIIAKDGALASGSGCCCSKCSGPCDEENPCPEGCVCKDGQCHPGKCCVSCADAPAYTDKQTCEECGTVNTCYESMQTQCTYSPPDENGQCPEGAWLSWNGECEQCEPCPEGWSGSGGWCSRVTNPASCNECNGFCDSFQTGACGEWVADDGDEHACDPGYCRSYCSFDSVIPGCSPAGQCLRYAEPLSPFPPFNAFTYNPGYDPGEACGRLLMWVHYRSVGIKVFSSNPFVRANNIKVKFVLYEVDCESGTWQDVTSAAVSNPAVLSFEGCIAAVDNIDGLECTPEQAGETPPAPDFAPEPTLVCENPFP